MRSSETCGCSRPFYEVEEHLVDGKPMTYGDGFFWLHKFFDRKISKNKEISITPAKLSYHY